MKKQQILVSGDEINNYIKDIRKIELITHERQDEIFKKLNSENLTKKERASLLNELVVGNLRFVISVAKSYQNQGLDLLDLISEGNIGLLKAVERFDPGSGIRFISYAVHWVKQSIMASLNDNARTIRIPSNLIQEHHKNNKKTMEESEAVTTTLPYCVGLFKEINEDGNQLIDIIPNENADDPEDCFNNPIDIKNKVDVILKNLDEREKIIIEKCFGLNGEELSLEELGEELGCSKERVRQLREKAIKKLRNGSFELLNNI